MLIFKKTDFVPDDLEAIFRDSMIQERYFADSDKLHHSLETGAKNGELYLGVLDGMPVGAMRVDMRGFCGLYPYIKLLGVAPAYRSQGIGTFMLEKAEQMARDSGAKKITLMVSDFNIRAQKAYERRGYELLGTIRNAVKDDIDELLMIKYL